MDEWASRYETGAVYSIEAVGLFLFQRPDLGCCSGYIVQCCKKHHVFVVSLIIK